MWGGKKYQTFITISLYLALLLFTSTSFCSDRGRRRECSWVWGSICFLIVIAHTYSLIDWRIVLRNGFSSLFLAQAPTDCRFFCTCSRSSSSSCSSSAKLLWVLQLFMLFNFVAFGSASLFSFHCLEDQATCCVQLRTWSKSSIGRRDSERTKWWASDWRTSWQWRVPVDGQW